MNLAPVTEVALNRIEGQLPNGHDPLPSTFAEEPD
jgi:hypothetical protein